MVGIEAGRESPALLFTPFRDHVPGAYLSTLIPAFLSIRTATVGFRRFIKLTSYWMGLVHLGQFRWTRKILEWCVAFGRSQNHSLLSTHFFCCYTWMSHKFFEFNISKTESLILLLPTKPLHFYVSFSTKSSNVQMWNHLQHLCFSLHLLHPVYLQMLFILPLTQPCMHLHPHCHTQCL